MSSIIIIQSRLHNDYRSAILHQLEQNWIKDRFFLEHFSQPIINLLGQKFGRLSSVIQFFYGKDTLKGQTNGNIVQRCWGQWLILSGQGWSLISVLLGSTQVFLCYIHHLGVRSRKGLTHKYFTIGGWWLYRTVDQGGLNSLRYFLA